jgi:type I restriction-modification system DNA methylase subunit/restriction endonuclease S subunit
MDITTDLQNLSVDELVEINKTRGLDYLTKSNKPRAKSVLIRNIEKDMKEKRKEKPYKAKSSNNNIDIGMEEEQTFMNEEVQDINEIVWTLEENSDTNVNYKQMKDKLKNTIKSCHNSLRDDNSVVGTKAQNDIMKILTIRILQSQFENEESELYKKCKKLLDDDGITLEKYEKYMSYCCDLTKIRKSDNPLNEWKMYVLNFLQKIFKGIYSDEDSTFNFGKDEKTLMKLIEIICKLEVDKDFIDAFSTSYGDIHEAFREYSGGKGAKELGQFFTPRHLIHSLLHGCGLNDIIKGYGNPSIYDCCMGTGGLLTRAYSNGNVSPANIYGCETEKDTIKFGQCSLLLATGEFNSNIQLCNSVCDNSFIGTKKFDVIFTNPPFGTKMGYKDLEKRFNENRDSNSNGVNFKDVYPIDTNNGACLFTQHCIYMLEDNGTCAIVLPDGELFTGNTFKKFRKYMCDNVNILKIINVSGKAFEHTSIKTAVIIFQNNGSTKNIEFLDIPDDCNSVKRIMTIPINNIKNNNYNLSYSAYIKKEERCYEDGIVVKTLGEVCEFQNGSQLDKKDIIKGDIPIFGGGVKIVGYHNINNRFGNETIVCGTGLPGYVNYNYGNPFWASQCFTIKSKNVNILIDKYLYYYSKIILEIEFMSKQKGVAQKFIRYTQVTDIKIPIPSIERQQEIVEECEQITKSIDTIKLRKEQLKSDGILFKKYYKKNVLDEIYKNSEVKTLGEVCEVNQGTYIKPDMKIKGEYPVYGGGNISYYINQYNREDEIIVAKDGISIDCIRYEKNKFFLNHHGWTLTYKEEINKKYVLYYLQLIQPKLLSIAKGTAQLGINQENFYKIKIPIPSLENQEKIVAYYEQMNDEYKKHILDRIEEYNKELEMLKDLCVNMFYVS